MRKNIALGVLLVFAACGCASAGNIQSLTGDKLYFSIYSPESKKQIRRQEIVRRNPEWSEDVQQNVSQGKISKGMTKIQVLSSYGKPLEILGTVNDENRDHSLWIYPEAYLIFDNDQLVSIEETVKIEVKPSIIEKTRYGM